MFQIQKWYNTGPWYSVEYSSFSLGPEADNYRLSISGFSGDEGDAMTAHSNPLRNVNGMPFTTPDRDNDYRTYGLCFEGRSGWWFNKCARGALNFDTNAMWDPYTDDGDKDFVSSRMMVKLD